MQILTFFLIIREIDVGVIKELEASEQFNISVLPGSLSRRFSVKKENGLCRLKA